MSKNISTAKLIEVARAIHRQQSSWAKVVKSPLTYSTTEIHKALVNAGVFSTPIEMKQGWSTLAKLAYREFPGVRRAAPVVSKWRGRGGEERVVRPLEWVHITDTQLAAWEQNLLESKQKVQEDLSAMVKELQGRVEHVEKLLAEALGTVSN